MADHTLQDHTALVAKRARIGVTADEPMSEAGRKILGFHFAKFLRYEAGVRDGATPRGIEAIHDMRVTSRRLRSAFEIFETYYQPESVRLLIKLLRRVGRALGAVRDLDVFIEQTSAYIVDYPADELPSFNPLFETLRAKRDRAHADLMELFDSGLYARFLAEFAYFVNTPLLHVKPMPEAAPFAHRVRYVLPKLVVDELTVIYAYAHILNDASLDTLHMLRIEAKRMRYTLDAFAEILGSSHKTMITAIKVLQEYLGNLQDARMAVITLRAYTDSVSTDQVTTGLFHYLNARKADKLKLRTGIDTAWAAFSAPTIRKSVFTAIANL